MLPPIDIDSISPSSSRISSNIEIGSPQHANVTFLHDAHEETEETVRFFVKNLMSLKKVSESKLIISKCIIKQTETEVYYSFV